MDIEFVDGAPPSQMLEDDPPYSPYDFHGSPPLLSPISPGGFRHDIHGDSPDDDDESFEDMVRGTYNRTLVTSQIADNGHPSPPDTFSTDSSTSDMTSERSPDATIISSETINMVTETVSVIPWQEALNDMTPVFPNTVFSFESDNEDLDADDKEMVSGHSFTHEIDLKDEMAPAEMQADIVECESATEMLEALNSESSSASYNPLSTSSASINSATATVSSVKSTTIPASTISSTSAIASTAKQSTPSPTGPLDLTGIDPTTVFPEMNQPGVPQGPRFSQSEKSASNSLMNIVSLLTNKAQLTPRNKYIPDGIRVPDTVLNSKAEMEAQSLSATKIKLTESNSKQQTGLKRSEIKRKHAESDQKPMRPHGESIPNIQTEQPLPLIKIKEEPKEVIEVNNNFSEKCYSPKPKRRKPGYKSRPHHRNRIHSVVTPPRRPMSAELAHHLNLSPNNDSRIKSSLGPIPIHVGNGQKVPIDYRKIMEAAKSPITATSPQPAPKLQSFQPPHTPSPPIFPIHMPSPRLPTQPLQSPVMSRIQAHYPPSIPITVPQPPQQQEPLCLTVPKAVPNSNQPVITVPISPHLNLTIPVTTDLLRKLALPALASLMDPDALQKLILANVSNSAISPETLQQFAAPPTVPPTVHVTQPSVPTAYVTQPSVPTVHVTQPMTIPTVQVTQPTVTHTRPHLPKVHIKQEPKHQNLRHHLVRPASLTKPAPIAVPITAKPAQPPQTPPKFVYRQFSYPGAISDTNPIALSTKGLSNRYAAETPPSQPQTPVTPDRMLPRLITSPLGTLPLRPTPSPLGTLPLRPTPSPLGTLPLRPTPSPSGSLPYHPLQSPTPSDKSSVPPSPSPITSPNTLLFEDDGEEDTGQIYRCDDCVRTFKHRLSLTNHQRAHGSKQPHICFLCKEHFKYKTNLKRHLRIHAREMRICKYCHAILDSDYELVQHEKEHRKVLSAKDAEAIAVELENRLINGSFQGVQMKPEQPAQPVQPVAAMPDSTTASA